MPCRLQLPRLRIIKIYENITQISAHLRKRLSVSVSGLLNITELEKRTQASTSQRKNICHHPEPSENAFGDKFEGILKTLMCREISSLKEQEARRNKHFQHFKENQGIKLLIWPRGDLQKPRDVAWIQSGSPWLWAFKPPLAENRIPTEGIRCVSGWVSGPHFGPICQMPLSAQHGAGSIQSQGSHSRMNCKAITASATQGRCEG